MNPPYDRPRAPSRSGSASPSATTWSSAAWTSSASTSAPVPEVRPDPVAAVARRAADVRQDDAVAGAAEQDDLDRRRRRPGAERPAVDVDDRRERLRPAASAGEAIHVSIGPPGPGAWTSCMRGHANRSRQRDPSRVRIVGSPAPSARRGRRRRLHRDGHELHRPIVEAADDADPPVPRDARVRGGGEAVGRHVEGRQRAGIARRPARRGIHGESPRNRAAAIGDDRRRSSRRRPRPASSASRRPSRACRCRTTSRAVDPASARAATRAPSRRPGRRRAPGSCRRPRPGRRRRTPRASARRATTPAWSPVRRPAGPPSARRCAPSASTSTVQIDSMGRTSASGRGSATNATDLPSGDQASFETPQSPARDLARLRAAPRVDHVQVRPAIDEALLVPAPVDARDPPREGSVVTDRLRCRRGSAAGRPPS